MSHRTRWWRLRKRHGGHDPIFSSSSIGQAARKPTQRPKNASIRSRVRYLHRRSCSARGVLGLQPPVQETLKMITTLPGPLQKTERLAAARTRRLKLSLSSTLAGVRQQGVVQLAALFRYPTCSKNYAPFRRKEANIFFLTQSKWKNIFQNW